MENVANIQCYQYQFSISMKQEEELWVGVGIGEPETSNQQPETRNQELKIPLSNSNSKLELSPPKLSKPPEPSKPSKSFSWSRVCAKTLRLAAPCGPSGSLRSGNPIASRRAHLYSASSALKTKTIRSHNFADVADVARANRFAARALLYMFLPVLHG